MYFASLASAFLLSCAFCIDLCYDTSFAFYLVFYHCISTFAFYLFLLSTACIAFHFLPCVFRLQPFPCALTPFFYLLICFGFLVLPSFLPLPSSVIFAIIFQDFFGFNYLNHFLLFLSLAFSYYHMTKHCLLSLPSAFTFCLWLLLLFFAFAFHLYISFSCPFSQYSYHFLLFTYICQYNLFNIFVIFWVQLP